MKCLVCTCFDVSSFFGTVENLGWGDVERGQTKIFDPPRTILVPNISSTAD